MTLPPINVRDDQGILRCLSCGRRTGHDALKAGRSDACCTCWPHEVAVEIERTSCIRCEADFHRNNPPGCELCGTCERCGCLDNEAHQKEVI